MFFFVNHSCVKKTNTISKHLIQQLLLDIKLPVEKWKWAFLHSKCVLKNTKLNIKYTPVEPDYAIFNQNPYANLGFMRLICTFMNSSYSYFNELSFHFQVYNVKPRSINFNIDDSNKNFFLNDTNMCHTWVHYQIPS